MRPNWTRRALAALLLCFAVGTAHAQVVISQLYGGGGNSGAPYNADYIELFNRGNAAVSLGGKSVQYTSATGTGNFGANTGLLVALPNVELQPGQYFLVGLAGGANGSPLPTPDATGTINMAAAAGKAVLAEGTSSLGCNGANNACSDAQLARIIDLVGFGSANFFEGSAAAPGLSNTLAGFRADDGCTDSDDNGADFSTGAPAPRNSSSAHNPCDGGGTPTIAINDASIAEGDSGLTPLFFNITLNFPAPEGGVHFDWSTADGSARAGVDYVAAGGTGVLIAEGQSGVVIHVDVIGNTVVEADKVFYVNLSNLEGAEPGKLQGVGTILNDDFEMLSIQAIQGTGQRSPYEDQLVGTSGIVTARKNNGFFIQTATAEVDAQLAASSGLFVFTGAAPGEQVQPGNKVRVQGRVIEYVPAADPYQLPLTEITNATVLLESTGYALPAPVLLTRAELTNSGGQEQLERYEGMRVSADYFTVVAPTGGFTNERNATGSSNGRFAVVITDTPRPLRGPGLPEMDPLPLGNTATDIPRWNMNPEIIAVTSTTLGLPALDVAAGCRLQSLVGPLDYGFRRFTILPEATPDVDCDGADQPMASTAPSADHATFATYNLQRFFDTVSDPGTNEPVLTPEALEARLNKASIGIRDYLHAPDVIGVTEVENLSVLTLLANRINADAVAAGQADPGYVAYLEEGNDIGGIDVGFLVRTDRHNDAPRVRVDSVRQYGADTLMPNPNGSSSILNDRPPFVLDAVVNFDDGREYPVTVIVVHHRSLSGVQDDSAGSAGWATTGDRVRGKRQAQAKYLADLIQTKQAEDAQRQIVVLGDFNAFEFNDGLVDVVGVITGRPSTDNSTVVPGDGSSPVTPALHNATLLGDASQRYSFVFDYNAQSLDHVLFNQAIVDSPLVADISVSHARLNADFPETARNDGNSPLRLSDHDPTVLLLRIASLEWADLDLSAEAMAASVEAGGQLQFSAVLNNRGPDDARFPGVGFALDAALPDLLVSPGNGFSCEAPEVIGGETQLACNAERLDAGNEAVFVLSATADAALVGREVNLASSATAYTRDPDETNNQAQASIAVVAAEVPAPWIGNGQTETGLAGAAGDVHLFRIEVPAGARNLRFNSFGGTGEVSMYVANGRAPTALDHDLASRRPGNTEVVHVANPAAGTWYVALVGERAHARISLRVSFQP